MAGRIAEALVVAAVAVQLAYPLTSGGGRDVLAVLIVTLLAGAAVAHAAAVFGGRLAAGLLAVTALPGFVAEIAGVHTGVPFGHYAYGTGLGPRVLAVPVVVALAWTMLAYPAALVARRLVRGRIARVVLGAWALAVTDLFLDPQMTAAGYWRWAAGGTRLPGTAVPLTNYAGWLVVALVLSALLQAVLPDDDDVRDALPLAVYGWLFLGWTVALAVFEGLPAAAGWGALGMGSVTLPLLFVTCRPRRPARRPARLGPVAAAATAGRTAPGPTRDEPQPAALRG